MLDELVHEYCVYRGIVDSVVPSAGMLDPLCILILHLLLNVNLQILNTPHFFSPTAPVYPADTDHLKANQLNATGGLSSDNFHDVDCGNNKHSEDGSSIINAHADGTEISTETTRTQDMDVEMRFPCESVSNHDNCSTSGTHRIKNLRICQRNRGHTVEGRRRKRWRERNEDFDFPAGVHCNESSKQEVVAVLLKVI